MAGQAARCAQEMKQPGGVAEEKPCMFLSPGLNIQGKGTKMNHLQTLIKLVFSKSETNQEVPAPVHVAGQTAAGKTKQLQSQRGKVSNWLL